MPLTTLLPVLAPLRFRVVLFAPVETPVTAPMFRKLFPSVALAVKLADPPSPSMTMALAIVSMWATSPASVWITPALFNNRVPPARVKPKLEVLPNEMPPMPRLASTVTACGAVSVKPNVAMSALAVSSVAPGAAAGVQLLPAAQAPSAFTFHEALAPRAEWAARKAAMEPARMRVV